MSGFLAEYEKRLAERDINALDSEAPKKDIRVENIKFRPSGEIKLYFGLTCIVRIDPKSKLFDALSIYQDAVKKELDQAGLGNVFSFLNPASFHMTICDILASPIQILSRDAGKYIAEIQRAFSGADKKEPITSQVQGIGFSSTITALVRFEEEELRKTFALEQLIKDATRVDIRNFTGHISLAYCVSDPGEAVDKIKEILRSKMGPTFGDLTFNQFYFSCFTDMNTYIPLLSVNFEENQIIEHQEFAECIFC